MDSAVGGGCPNGTVPWDSVLRSSPLAPNSRVPRRRACRCRLSRVPCPMGHGTADRRLAGRTPWMRTLALGHHEDRTPTHGYAATRLAAMAAFAKSWRRE